MGNLFPDLSGVFNDKVLVKSDRAQSYFSLPATIKIPGNGVHTSQKTCKGERDQQQQVKRLWRTRMQWAAAARSEIQQKHTWKPSGSDPFADIWDEIEQQPSKVEPGLQAKRGSSEYLQQRETGRFSAMAKSEHCNGG